MEKVKNIIIYKTYDHLKFEGEYINDERNGEGKEFNLSGKLMFEGEFETGKKWKGKIIKYIVFH